MWGRGGLERLFRDWRRPRRRTVEAFTAWAREHAEMLDPLDGANTDIERLTALDGCLAGKRIVYLGEEDHWIHEKSDYRLLLLRYLFSRGWRYVGEELGWSDGVRIDRYLETGDESQLARAATYGYRGALRTDRDDRPTGILKDTSQTYPERAFAAEQIRLAIALRSLSESRRQGTERLHFFGFDIDALAGGGYEDLAELLRPVDALVAAALKTRLARVPGETLQDEIARLTSALAHIGVQEVQLKGLLGEGRYAQLRQWTLTLRDSLDFVRVANPATNWETLNTALAAREEAMFRHVKFMLSQMEPDAKLVLMGHNRHLSKEMRLIKNPGAAPPGGKRVPSVGTFLNHFLPGEVFSLWMLHDHGTGSQPFSWLSSEYVSVPGSLNAALAEVGEVYLLPTATSDPRARLLTTEMEIVGLYNAVYRAAIARQADAIFFVREVSPLRP